MPIRIKVTKQSYKRKNQQPKRKANDLKDTVNRAGFTELSTQTKGNRLL